MAKKLQGCDYSSQIKKLNTESPGRSYVLYGPEDYLRDSFLAELKKKCIPEGESGFNYHRFDGPAIDSVLLSQALNSMPFLGDRVFVEIHDADFSTLENLDIPDYCTVAFVNKEIDGRLKFVKSIENNLCFVPAEQNSLFRWIERRFKANGKEIDTEAIKRLIFISGDLMSRLIPEIEKISGYTKSERVSISDVNAVASHIPEADVFEMVNFLADKNYDEAVRILSELLENRDNSPISLISSISYQFRRIYIAKLFSSKSSLMDFLDIKYDFIADRLINTARKYSVDTAKKAVTLCCDTEFRIKQSYEDDRELLKNLIVQLWKN